MGLALCAVCATMKTAVKEPSRQTIRRRLDDPKLEVGETISLKDDANGVVIARYIPSGRSDEVCYIVEVISDDQKKRPG